MPGRAVVAFLLLFLSTNSAFPQCDYTPRYSGQFRSSVLDLSIDGNDLWTATTYGVALYDRAVTPPELIATTALPGITRVIRTAGGTAYAGSGSRIVVLRRSGNAISIVRIADAGAEVNDLLLVPGYLFAATSNGLAQFNISDSSNPVRTPVQFATSANVTGLAVQGFTLYVADSDSTIEVFSIADPSSPQKTGSLNSLPRSETVIATSGRLYVSDGQNTVVFLSSGTVITNVATLPIGATSFAGVSGEVGFVAGSDRRIRAVDFLVPGNPVRLFEADIPATGGTVNRIGALQVAGGRLYAAAGDAGLVVYDIGAFTAPYAVQALSGGGTTTIVSAGNRFYAARATGGFVEYSRGSTGQLTEARTWDSARIGAVHEVTANGFILTSSDRTVTYSTLSPVSPTTVSTATFRQPIVSAVLSGNIAYVVLQDRTLWSANMGLLSPVALQVATPGVNPSSIARSGTSFAITDLRDDRTTRIAFYPTSDFNNPRIATVDGAATAGLTLAGTTAVVFTFRGLSVIDFSSATPTSAILPESASALVRSLSARGNTLLTLEEQTVSVWDLAARRRTRQIRLPAEGVALHVGEGETPYADVATGDGVAAVAFTSSSQSPLLRSTGQPNRYYKDIAAFGDRLYLFDGQVIDVFSTGFGSVPHHLVAIRVPGIVDFAVAPENIFVLTGGRAILAYSRDGFLLGQTTLPETATTESLAVEAVGGAPWVSITRGCPLACEQETVVLDPRSLVATARLSGTVTDVITSGNRAYALFEVPNEVRAFDISDPLHPSPLANRPIEGNRQPVSIVHSNGIVYVLGERLYAYSQTDLTSAGTQFDSYSTDITGTLAYVDQRAVIEGNCALVTGRTFDPQFFGTASPGQWTPLSTIVAPATVRGIAATPGRLFVLTDHSIEVLSTTEPPSFPRKRAVR